MEPPGRRTCYVGERKGWVVSILKWRIPWMVASARWIPSGSLFIVDSTFLIKDSIACESTYWWELVSRRGWMLTLTTVLRDQLDQGKL